jgi:hypothetical protein
VTKKPKKSGERLAPPHGGAIRDRRAEFARLTRQSGRDQEAERAFIESKMRLVRTDPHLSEREKKRILKELEQKLPSPP